MRLKASPALKGLKIGSFSSGESSDRIRTIPFDGGICVRALICHQNTEKQADDLILTCSLGVTSRFYKSHETPRKHETWTQWWGNVQPV